MNVEANSQNERKKTRSTRLPRKKGVRRVDDLNNLRCRALGMRKKDLERAGKKKKSQTWKRWETKGRAAQGKLSNMTIPGD